MKKEVLIASVMLITIGLVLISSSIVSAQSNNEFTVPLTDPSKRGKLKAHLNYGSITIKGTARKDVLVKYTAVEDEDRDNRKGGTNSDGLKRIGGGGMDLEAVENSNFVKVQSDSWSRKINLEIEVPSGFDMEVHTYNDGDLFVSNIQGETELTNYNGEIQALSISGSVVATTYNGDIKVTFDKVTENTPMSFSTYNGDIDLTFPASLKAALKMKTEQGEIFTGFDVNMVSTGPVQKKDARSGVYRVSIDDWKRANVNGGGPEFTMKNYNGDIYIRKK
ncbi:DUF4097 family beta strand repeat-containing protein [Chryseosolibacter indicus]|uniref:DUF4097 family beta strand repeat protein n=1 Tax=Chryseosolibacter indicus TaxID=2782351 RepID=A0ABS5VW60_9BACT|nr:DUF4097 family beta strand repeat-containing protein [Chryseosolibacter indicus]MBT1705662.1 DUF4097 family beta strand repeat protein [Chryseosolibacter indicus]